MKKIIIDTNCLISFVSDRNADQQEKIAALFNKTKQLKSGVICHHHVISEFVYVLTSVYSLKADKVQQMVADLISMPGVTYTSDVDMHMLLSLWPKSIPDYGDAVLAAYCKKTKGTSIATFDKKFHNALISAGLTIVQL
ncbi:PIN domain-containing protein [Desulfocastanea catecholica]